MVDRAPSNKPPCEHVMAHPALADRIGCPTCRLWWPGDDVRRAQGPSKADRMTDGIRDAEVFTSRDLDALLGLEPTDG